MWAEVICGMSEQKPQEPAFSLPFCIVQSQPPWDRNGTSLRLGP